MVGVNEGDEVPHMFMIFAIIESKSIVNRTFVTLFIEKSKVKYFIKSEVLCVNVRLKALTDSTKQKFGLDNYYLHRHTFYRKLNIFNETEYTLCMEWFPTHITEQEDEDLNPEGTAVININVNNGMYESVIFVGGKSYASGNTFKDLGKIEIVKWIENETGLIYEKQFQLILDEERDYRFQECVDGIPVSPSGNIAIKFDEEGNLTEFYKYGHYPSKEWVTEESYSLSLEDMEQLVKAQLKLIEIPAYDQEVLILAYGLEEIYVTNDRKSTIPFELIVNTRYIKIDKIMDWTSLNVQMFERTEISWIEDVTIEQVFSNEPHPDSIPLSKLEQEKSIHAVIEFLRNVYPNDSADWTLKTLHRDTGNIHAILKVHKEENRAFQRKLLIIIDAQRFQAINYMDNESLLETFHLFKAPDEITINNEEAFEQIRKRITLEPYYVFNSEQQRYILCGKIDCNYVVNASNGEAISLNDL
ncbi:hypothetical protein SAMN05421578_10433 [Paenibacillus macquariensis]|uniref:Uncharacterized protein n=1 Tax=Paenibacillus macquariensis TaxID=948756 RepID=A0ABY1JU31_9BACL|nr:hypothetical protein SAMN05421578_10433 [Paenibacillus macquariensis]